MEPDQTFAQLFVAAQQEILNPRSCRIIALKYGFLSGEPHTLVDIGKSLSLSKERIRQIIERSLRAIRAQARWEIEQGKVGACAALIMYTERICKPNEEGYQERYLAFVRHEMPHLPLFSTALPLLLGLLPSEERVRPVIVGDLHEWVAQKKMSIDREPCTSWIIDQILPTNQLSAVIGPPGVGKTFLLTDWACCCAMGRSWCGYATLSPQSVLYIRPCKSKDFLHRAKAWCLHRQVNSDEMSAKLHWLDIHQYAYDQRAVYRAVRNVVQQQSISLAIFDECPWEHTISPFVRDLQSRGITIVFSSSASVKKRNVSTFRLKPLSAIGSRGEIALSLLLPKVCTVSSIRLEMVRVSTPGDSVDSYGESCVVLQPVPDERQR